MTQASSSPKLTLRKKPLFLFSRKCPNSFLSPFPSVADHPVPFHRPSIPSIDHVPPLLHLPLPPLPPPASLPPSFIHSPSSSFFILIHSSVTSIQLIPSILLCLLEYNSHTIRSFDLTDSPEVRLNEDKTYTLITFPNGQQAKRFAIQAHGYISRFSRFYAALGKQTQSAERPTIQPSKTPISSQSMAAFSPPVGAAGLFNLGNTCYINSIHQALSHSIVLTSYFISYRFLRDYREVSTHPASISLHYAQLMRDISVSPSSDAPFCEHCKRKRAAVRSLQVKHFPFYLCIQLLRFHPDHKITAMVKYPIIITGRELSAFEMDTPKVVGYVWAALRPHYSLVSSTSHSYPTYDLYAVVCHRGLSMTEGHYAAYALNPYDNQWRYFNDDKAETVTANEAIDKDAYLLFYRRRCVPSDRTVLEVAQTRMPVNVISSLSSVELSLLSEIQRVKNSLIHHGSNSFRTCFIGGVMTTV